tara:strand:- start:624 stop:1001 length:378 start_codon:yes stop_codon:yes gene_type:complete
MPSGLVNLGLTKEARSVCDAIKENLSLHGIEEVRDLAVVHAIRKELDPTEETDGQKTTVWNVGSLDSDLLDLLEVLYPEACVESDKTHLFRNLLHLGLLDLGQDPEFDSWSQLSHLPGFSGLSPG